MTTECTFKRTSSSHYNRHNSRVCFCMRVIIVIIILFTRLRTKRLENDKKVLEHIVSERVEEIKRKSELIEQQKKDLVAAWYININVRYWVICSDIDDLY